MGEINFGSVVFLIIIEFCFEFCLVIDGNINDFFFNELLGGV